MSNKHLFEGSLFCQTGRMVRSYHIYCISPKKSSIVVNNTKIMMYRPALCSICIQSCYILKRKKLSMYPIFQVCYRYFGIFFFCFTNCHMCFYDHLFLWEHLAWHFIGSWCYILYRWIFWKIMYLLYIAFVSSFGWIHWA